MIFSAIPVHGECYYADTNGLARGIYVSENFAYIADRDSGLAIVDVSDPTNPGTPVYMDTASYALDIVKIGEYAFVADYYSGLAIIDVSDPTDPGAPVYEDTTGNAIGVFVNGEYAYIADGSSGLAIINVSDPTDPGAPVYEDTVGSAAEVVVSEGYAYIADGSSGLAIINVSDPTDPGAPFYMETPGNAHGLFISEDYLYVMASPTTGSNYIAIFNIINPNFPRFVDVVEVPSSLSDIFYEAPFAYIAAGEVGIGIFRIPRYGFEYTFTKDLVSTIPDGWTYIPDPAGSGSVKVVSGWQGRSKVMVLDDEGDGNPCVETYFPDTNDGGLQIEFFIGITDTESGTTGFYGQTVLWDGPYDVANLIGHDGYFKTFDYSSSIWETTGVPFAVDTWYHIQFVLNFTSETYDLYIDGISAEENQVFGNNSNIDSVNRLSFNGQQAEGTPNLYIENVFCSSGFYMDSTYDFRDDAAGTIPDGWTFIPGNEYDEAEVVSEWEGRSNVFCLDESGTTGPYVETYFPDTNLDGFDAEFYLGVTNTYSGTSGVCGQVLLWDGGSVCVNFALIDGCFQYYNDSGSSWETTGVAFAVDAWYHVRIVMNFTGNTYDLFINGEEGASGIGFVNSGSVDSVNRIFFTTTQDPGNPDLYIDNFYCSAIAYINWTNNFRDDAAGTIPDGWTFIPGNEYDEAEVVSEWEGRSNVFCLDESGTTGPYVETYFPDTNLDGFDAEFYLGVTNTYSGTSGVCGQVLLWDGGSVCVNFALIDGCFQYYNDSGSSWETTGVAFAVDAWYHVRIVMNFTGNTYDLFINGEEGASGIGFVNLGSVDSVNRIFFTTTQDPGNPDLYIDNVDFA